MISEEDKTLFRENAEKGDFLDKDSPAKLNKKQFKPFTGYSYISCADYTANEIIEHQGSISNKIFKQMKRGNIDAPELDLHGHCVKQACQKMSDFIYQHQHRKFLRIIHGKGLNNKNNKSLLKTQAVSFLKYHPQVLAFCSCPNQEGGTGALYVYLKNV
jgi:DNA-nicking Smr family endonuclease